MKILHVLAALILAAARAPAFAGPPYLTDDPVPTETGHWELYGFTAGEGLKSTVDGEAGFDLNYGPVEDIQLTATLPISFAHSPAEGWQSGSGDVEIGVKYRFYHDKDTGLSAAIFPRVILPTANRSTNGKARLLLPVWIGKDFRGGTSLFGGGGYEINPGAGNRDFWEAAIALTHDLNSQISVGAEITRQGPDSVGGTTQTRAGLGTILQLGGPASLLLSGGPTWSDHQTGYHFYGAVGFNF